MFWTGLIIFIILMVFFIVSQRYKKRKNRLKEIDAYNIAVWNKAREDRERWREDRKDYYDFFTKEYQSLWMLEIGAEAFYIINTRENHQEQALFEHRREWLEFENRMK